jgi:hypothetical protein
VSWLLLYPLNSKETRDKGVFSNLRPQLTPTKGIKVLFTIGITLFKSFIYSLLLKNEIQNINSLFLLNFIKLSQKE